MNAGTNARSRMEVYSGCTKMGVGGCLHYCVHYLVVRKSANAIIKAKARVLELTPSEMKVHKRGSIWCRPGSEDRLCSAS